MKKKLLFIPLVLIGLVLSGCASGLKDNFTEEDQVIDTPWSDYVLPASTIEFAAGEDNLTLVKGDTHTYQYTISPATATKNSVSWFSSNENVATVNEGVLTAVGGGQTTITVSSVQNSFDPIDLNVTVSVPLTDFSVSVPNKMEWEEQYELSVTYVPEDTTERDVLYEITQSSPEGLVSVNEQGVLSSSNQNGTAKLKVTIGKIVKEYNLTVESVPVSSVTVNGNAHEVEVNHTLELTASVLPANARDLLKKGVKFYSRNTDIATVDEITGVVLGVSAGTANIYAKCGEVESADYAVTVFKVNATAVNISTADFTLSNAQGGTLTKQLEYSLTLDRAGYTEPSDATVSFASNDVAVATVSNTGLVTATGPGNAVITVTVAQPGLDNLTDTVNVSVNIISTALNIVGGNSFYNDSELTLTAILTPANVSNNEITWAIVSGADKVSLSATTGASVTLIPLNNEVTGEVKISATNTNGAHGEITVTVNERPSLFTAGHHYIVGNALYNTGESVRVDGKSSWSTAKYAYHFTYNVQDPSVYEQFKGTIKFQEGDQFRYFVGTDYWVPAWEQEEGWASRGWHIEQGGENNAFTKGQMRFVKENENHQYVVSDDPDANIEVVEAGYYDLYAKLYKNSDGTLWYSLYIQKVAALSVEISEVTMGLDESYQIQAHDWIGTLSFTIKSGADLITLSSTGLVTGKGTAGTAVVTVNDDRNVPVDVTITLQAGAHAGKVVYLNANGKFDTDGVVPFVHSWGGEGASAAADIMMEKVDGQTIIYTATLPVDHTKIDFVRCPAGATSLVWDDIYNQSKDQDIPTDGKDMFTMTGWTSESDGHGRTYLDGSWSTFDPSHTYVADGGSTEPGEENIITVYFCDIFGWANLDHKMSVYVWENNGDGKTPWPGEEATYVGLDNNDKNVYSYDVDLNAYQNIIFHVGDAKTQDIALINTDNQGFQPVQPAQVDNGYAVESYTYVPKEASPETYTVSFNANGGSGAKDPVTGVNGSYTLPDETGLIAPEGYEFVGWALSANGEVIEEATINVTADVVLYAIWTEAELPPEPEMVTIYLTANWSGWEAARAYVYNFDTDEAKAEWPGELMTYVGVNDDNDTIFSYTVDINQYDHIIFNNGSKETVSVNISESANADAYYLSAENGEGKVEVTKWGTFTNDALTSKQIFYFTNSKGWDNPHYYVFDSTNTNPESAGWPGESPKWLFNNEQGQGVYRLLIDTTLYDSFIFNGGGSQTVDIALSSLTDGHNAFYVSDEKEGDNYKVGQWTLMINNN